MTGARVLDGIFLLCGVAIMWQFIRSAQQDRAVPHLTQRVRAFTPRIIR